MNEWAPEFFVSHYNERVADQTDHFADLEKVDYAYDVMTFEKFTVHTIGYCTRLYLQRLSMFGVTSRSLYLSLLH